MAINRAAVKDADQVLGTLEEFDKWRIDPRLYLSCGDPAPNVARCPYAEQCTFGFKGKPGLIQVVDVEFGGRDQDDKVKVEAQNGKKLPVLREHVAGGPKNIAVYFKDNFTGGSKIIFIPCWRYYNNLKRWGAISDQGPVYVHAIIAQEGDGKLIPMKESRQQVAGTGKDGRPKWTAKHVRARRAVPFHPRPDEVLVDRAVDIEIENLVKDRTRLEMDAVVSGLRPEDRPLEVDLDALRQAHSGNQTEGG